MGNVIKKVTTGLNSSAMHKLESGALGALKSPITGDALGVFKNVAGSEVLIPAKLALTIIPATLLTVAVILSIIGIIMYSKMKSPVAGSSVAIVGGLLFACTLYMLKVRHDYQCII
jgi:hypothetical protein